ncbi:hypothetical protein BJV82DRAFT_618042 [Fennellomyces sp. T-0311]|nr:hypothetical protein BJV82DRAFT_618042 [Fennellomyces sp. T-0311]
MFRKLSSYQYIALCIVVVSVNFTAAADVYSTSGIGQCTPLGARAISPDDVRDLQVGDIKVVAGLGDSIMAGLLVMAHDEGSILGTGKIDQDALTEYRGLSYAVGGNVDAVTFPNFIKHYSPSVQGASTGKHLITPCIDEFCPQLMYKPRIDRLNAARSSATSGNLRHELDYLIPRMQKTKGIDFQHDWKIITINIGSNDQCGACGLRASDMTPEKYAENVKYAIERIRKSVPRVIVNLVGNFKVSQVYTFGKEADASGYCSAFLGVLNTQKLLCGCFNGPDDNRRKMDELAEGYNLKLEQIYDQYKEKQSKDFAVIYQPANIDISSFPTAGINNVDCFHPSIHTHEWIAKIIWNGLFLSQNKKPSIFKFDANMPVYCPNESDRIVI